MIYYTIKTICWHLIIIIQQFLNHALQFRATKH